MTVKQLIAQTLDVPVDTIDDSQTLEQVGLDSLDCAELTIDIEEAFGIELPIDIDASTGRMTVRELSALVGRLVEC